MFYVLCSAPAFAAEPSVTAQARLNRVNMTVGDLVEYELLVNAPTNVKTEIPPMPSKTFGEWEVRSCENLPTTTTNDVTQSGWKCVLTIWTTGYRPLPTQIVKITNPDGSTGRATTQPLSIEVLSVLDENPTDIKPLKPQLVMTEQANYLLIIGLSVLAVLLAGFAVWAINYYRKHRPIPVAVTAPTPPRDPFAVALTELERIAKLNLVQEGKIVEHYALIADVLRTFISDRFSVPAMERTTSEVRAALASPSMLQRRDLLLALLSEADGVKFARYLPTQNDAIYMIGHARQAILASR